MVVCHFLPLDLLTIEAHVFTPEPVKYDKKDGQWYAHDGVDVIDTQARKGAKSPDLFNSWICSQTLCLPHFSSSTYIDFC